jgi:CHAT domain-containing protein/tetratricopeptide (TPR) repeat protein
MPRNTWGVLILLLAIAGLARADEPQPKPLTEEQKTKLKERNRLAREAQQLGQAGKLDEMIAAWEKKLALERSVFGDLHEEVAASLAELASMHEFREDFDAARKARKEVLTLRTKLHGEKDWRVTDARLELEELEQLAHLDTKSRWRLLQAKDAASGLLNRLFEQGRAREALPLAQEILKARREILTENHPRYAESLHDLATLYHAVGDYGKALLLYERARDLTKKFRTENHPAYISNLNNLASLYQAMGDYNKALPLFEQACVLWKRLLTEDSPEYATSLNNLGTLYQDMGNYGMALLQYQQARNLRMKLLTENHPAYATSLNNLATLYGDMGDYSKALQLLEQAQALRRKLHIEKHPHYAASLNSLGLLYQYMGDYDKALRMYEEARDLNRKLRTEDHPEYANCLNNLASLYHDMGDYSKALLLYEQARNLRKKLLTENHPEYAESLNNLATLHADMGDYGKAIALLKQTCDHNRELLTENHPHYTGSLSSLALTYAWANQSDLAAPLGRQALRLSQFFLDRTFAVQSDRQRLDVLRPYQHMLQVYLTIVAPQAALATPQVYSDLLPWKAAAAGRRFEELLARDRPELRPLADQLRLAQASLGHMAQITPTTPELRYDWVKRFDALEAEVERLERALAEKSDTFRRFRDLRPAGSAEVAAALPRDASLVDFVAYHHHSPAPKAKPAYKVENRLLAFIVRRDRDPVCVPLGKADDIEEAIFAWRAAVLGGHNPEAAGAQLAKLVWQPLTKHLGDAKTVLLAPDGPLAFVPFAALPGSKPGTYLLEDMTFGYVTSGRHLLELAADADRPMSAGLLALGGLEYGPRPGRLKNVALAKDTRGMERAADVNPNLFLQAAYWNPLPGTRFEAERIIGTYRENFRDGRAPLLLASTEADADRLRRELTPTAETPRWRYLHLATHGYFQPPAPKRPGERPADLLGFDRERSFRTAVRNPLLMSGLVLAGANRSPDTGTLSAQEASTLDLRGAELVVLSACDTGLGKVADGEGVLGLQRAFQMAGARTVVASLWKVNDASTSVLMEEFYAILWQKKLPKLEALRQAQLKVLKNPALVRKRADELVKAGVRAPGDAEPLPKAGPKEAQCHPALWAAFVSYGDPGAEPEVRK